MPGPGSSTAASFWDDPVLQLQEWCRDLVNGAEEWVSSFTAGDWVLVAFAGAALFWIVASMRAMTRLGPIEIQMLEHDGEKDDGGNAVPVKALTGALREKLNANGLSPAPAVPAGAPQVNLISAVEASTIPQGAFIAKLLALLPKPPRPPEYTISGVLTGNEATGKDAKASLKRAAHAGPRQIAGDCPAGDRLFSGRWPGCRQQRETRAMRSHYWVRPSREGLARLHTVERCDTHTDAVDEAAFEIYRHVSNDAIHAFPVWARWRKAASLRLYLDGCKKADDASGSLKAAAEDLGEAERQEPLNALAPLVLANLYEGSVPVEPGFLRARAQAQALRRYLAIASDWPALVEARYRASVLAGALATTLEVPDRRGDGSGLDPDEKLRIRGQLAFSDMDTGDQVLAPAADPALDVDADADILEDVRNKLRDLAARESKAVLQLLKPWYALLRERRLRNQFEPKAYERRVVKHTVSISKHCVRMRALRQSRGLLTRCEIRYRSAAVHVGHMLLGKGSLNWQAHYNTACFDALLLHHLRELQNSPAQGRAQASGNPERRERRAKRVRSRTLDGLNTAFREAGSDLPWNWVERDPDFAVFTQAPLPEDEENWELRTVRIVEQTSTADQEDLAPASDDYRSIPLPARPWGNPKWRAWLWAGAVLMGVAVTLLFAFVLDATTYLVIAAAILVVFSVWRSWWARWEEKLTSGG